MNLNEKIEVLSAARQRISKPENFLQHMLTNGEGGCCAVGAITNPDAYSVDCYVNLPSEVQNICNKCLRELSKDLPQEWEPSTHSDQSRIVLYNNEHSHTEVLAMFDTTIKRLKRELVIENLKEAKVILETEGKWKVLEEV